MSQHLGAGAGQSIEVRYMLRSTTVLRSTIILYSITIRRANPTQPQDGIILARCLNRALSKDAGPPAPAAIESIVSTYNTLRVPIGNYVQERARLQGKVYELAFLDEPALKPEVCLCTEKTQLAFPSEMHDTDTKDTVLGGVEENAGAEVPTKDKDASKVEQMTNIYDLPPHYGALSELGKVSCLTTENYSWPSSRFVRRWDEEAERLLSN